MYIFAMSRMNGPFEIIAQSFNKPEVRPQTWSFNNMGFLLFESLCCSFIPVLWIFVVVLLLSFGPPTDTLTFCCWVSTYSLEFIGPSTIASYRGLEAAILFFPNMTLSIFTHKLLLSHLFPGHYSTVRKFRWSFANLKQAAFFLNSLINVFLMTNKHIYPKKCPVCSVSS